MTLPLPTSDGGGAVPGRSRDVAALVRAAHPGPGLLVTGLAVALAAAAGGGPGRCLLVGLAFALGQASVGWANDWLDADRDLAARRADKPLATGRLPVATVRRAALLAALAAVPASLLLGVAAGAAHLVAVASAWGYDAWLKRTPWSWTPFAVSFGLVPVVTGLAVQSQVPPSWLVTAAALLGVGAHLVDALPDLDDDRATGVVGAPHRLGRGGCGVLAPAVLLAATLLVAGGTGWSRGSVVAVVVSVVLAVLAVGAALRGARGHVVVLLAGGVAVVDLVLVVAGGALA